MEQVNSEMDFSKIGGIFYSNHDEASFQYMTREEVDNSIWLEHKFGLLKRSGSYLYDLSFYEDYMDLFERFVKLTPIDGADYSFYNIFLEDNLFSILRKSQTNLDQLPIVEQYLKNAFQDYLDQVIGPRVKTVRLDFTIDIEIPYNSSIQENLDKIQHHFQNEAERMLHRSNDDEAWPRGLTSINGIPVGSYFVKSV